MINDEQLEAIRPRLMINTIIGAAILMGGLMFGAVIGSTADWSLIGQPTKMLNTLGAGTAIVMYGLAFGVPQLFPRVPETSAPDPSDPGFQAGLQQIAGLLTTETITRFAILEGGVFLNITVFMLEPRWITAIAAGLGLLIMLFILPLPGRTIDQFQTRADQWQRGIR